MINVPFPAPQFRIQTRGGKRYIFDVIRKRWLLLTDEEWVRQNMVAFFTETLLYPREAIALEKGLLVNGLKKRFDLLVYNSLHQPWLLVECKAPTVPLNETVLQQVLRYHLTVPAAWLVLTNGNVTMAWEKKEDRLVLAEAFPVWQ